MKPRLVIVAITGLMLSACATPARFEWGGYEDQLYRYYRNAEHRDDYERALERAIAKGTDTNRVAPGLNAELGFLAYEDGNQTRARSYFETEMRLFPESRFFLQRYLNDGPVDGANDATPDAAEDAVMDASLESPTS